jgi:hypothetical protein
MNDRDFLREWSALTNAPDNFSDLEPWREYRDSAAQLVEALNARLRAADEAELVEAQAWVAALQSRVGVRPTPPPLPSQPPEYPAVKPRREIDANGIVASPSYAETDAGRGVGIREKPIDPVDFRNELAELRERTADKRARRGLS